MLRLRSWASSRMIVSYWRSIRSRCDLGEQDAVGHQLDQRPVADLVGEPHLAADDVAQRACPSSSAIRSATRAGGDPPRLGVPDPAAHARGPARAGSSAAGWSCPSRSRPATTTTWESRSAAAMSSRALTDRQLLGVARRPGRRRGGGRSAPRRRRRRRRSAPAAGPAPAGSLVRRGRRAAGASRCSSARVSAGSRDAEVVVRGGHGVLAFLRRGGSADPGSHCVRRRARRRAGSQSVYRATDCMYRTTGCTVHLFLPRVGAPMPTPESPVTDLASPSTGLDRRRRRRRPCPTSCRASCGWCTRSRRRRPAAGRGARARGAGAAVPARPARPAAAGRAGRARARRPLDRQPARRRARRARPRPPGGRRVRRPGQPAASSPPAGHAALDQLPPRARGHSRPGHRRLDAEPTSPTFTTLSAASSTTSATLASPTLRPCRRRRRRPPPRRTDDPDHRPRQRGRPPGRPRGGRRAGRQRGRSPTARS